eukprot:jgi/Mesen1/680/ME000109S10898
MRESSEPETEISNVHCMNTEAGEAVDSATGKKMHELEGDEGALVSAALINIGIEVEPKGGAWRKFSSKGGLLALGLGQVLALLVTTTGVTSSMLAQRGINAPTAQSFLNYLLLALVYGSILLFRRKLLQMPWHFYLALAVVDVEANYTVVLAYQYTSLTSVVLLDCWSIPCAMLLTWLLLKARYRKLHGLGALVCVVGLLLVMLSDAHAGDRTGGSRPLVGDVLVILGSMLYAASNVTEEFLAKRVDKVELLALVGAF